MDGRLVLLLVSVCVTLVSAASKIPKCASGDINKIKAFWKKIDGSPPDYILDTSGTFQVVLGTNSPVTGDMKCKHFTFIPTTGNQKSFLFSIQESKVQVPASEKNGVLTIKTSQETYTIYVIAFTGDLLAFYKCSRDGPNVSKTVAADVTIAIKPGAGKQELISITTVIKAMGFNVVSFGCK